MKAKPRFAFLKKAVVLLPLLAFLNRLNACPACSRQSGRWSGLVHGSGPEGKWDLVIVSLMMSVVLTTLVISIRMLVKPGEIDDRHIKRSIFK